MHTVGPEKLVTVQYTLTTRKKRSLRFNTLAQSPDMTSREYLGDHLKEQLRNR